ncbi:hypothetical protein RN001_000502 [Aquatica leii]|uniref:CCC domain-containing protein n=1 Tax=Aquatica leii TaxID=1421715 RepID=A0AAN7PK78_9COLE|nr:hypothetical protein RN001_000502 [Aquatica leii]
MKLLIIFIIITTSICKGKDVLDASRRHCPLCDSSVFSYCSDKLFHDSCCCNEPNSYYPLPFQCQFADCSFLHANTCVEHKLITACCCVGNFNVLYRQ